MNNLLETVWREYPHLFKGFKVKHKNNAGRTVISNIEGVDFVRPVLFTNRGTVKVDICTLLTRSIDSLTLEESCKIPSIKEEAENELRLVSLTDKIMWLNINIKLNRLSALDFFYLLSIGIWTGSTKNTEVIK